MPSYTTYMRQVQDSDDDIQWITMKGNHIPIKKGQTKEEAVKSFIERKKGVANEIAEREHGRSVGAWIGSAKEHKDLFYRTENGEIKSNEGMHKFAKTVETQVRNARKTKQFKDSVLSAHSIAMGDLQKNMPASMKKTFTTERHKELMEKKFKDKDENVISGNWDYTKQYRNEFFDKEGNWLDNEAEKRYEYIKNVEKKFDEIYSNREFEAMKHAANEIWKSDKKQYNKTELAPKEKESDLKKWDKEVTKYHDEEEKVEQTRKAIQSDLGKFADAYNKLYKDSDAFTYNPSDLDKEYNKAMHNDKFKEWVQSMVKERGDVFASDRELHALLIVAKEKGLIPQEKKAKAKSKGDSPLVKAVAKALGKSEAEAESEIDGAAQYIKDLMKANDLRNGDVEETLRGLGVEPDYAEEFLHWATYMKNKK